MELMQIAPFLSSAIALTALAYTIVSNRSRAAKDELHALGAKVDGLDDRLGRAEGELRHLPAKDDVHEVKLTLAELQGEIRGMAAQIAPIGKIADRLQEFLLDEARRR